MYVCVFSVFAYYKSEITVISKQVVKDCLSHT
jgi:hypothetical protein